jgi:hypothetical protein
MDACRPSVEASSKPGASAEHSYCEGKVNPSKRNVNSAEDSVRSVKGVVSLTAGDRDFPLRFAGDM